MEYYYTNSTAEQYIRNDDVIEQWGQAIGLLLVGLEFSKPALSAFLNKMCCCQKKTNISKDNALTRQVAEGDGKEDDLLASDTTKAPRESHLLATMGLTLWGAATAAQQIYNMCTIR